MESLPLETIGLGGAIAVALVALVLWKLLKLALKVVLFVVGVAAIAGVVALYLEGARPALPVDSPSDEPAGTLVDPPRQGTSAQ